MSKINYKVANECRRLFEEGIPIFKIAKQFHVAHGTICRRILWAGGTLPKHTTTVVKKGKRIFTEEHRKHLSESCTGRVSEKKGIPMSSEQKEKIRASVQKTMRTPEMRDYISKTMIGKLCGPKHPSWQGGISQKYASGYVNKYPAAFNKALRRTIMDRDAHTCQHCGTEEDLTVHHIDYDKHNNDPLNLVTACRSCNGVFNFDRESWMQYWKEFFQETCA